MQARLAENQAIAQADDFVARITAEIHRRGVQTLRIHVSGDFYEADYVKKWAAITRRCPRTTFTRTRDPGGCRPSFRPW
jgi:hypothetical protein